MKSNSSARGAVLHLHKSQIQFSSRLVHRDRPTFKPSKASSVFSRLTVRVWGGRRAVVTFCIRTCCNIINENVMSTCVWACVCVVATGSWTCSVRQGEQIKYSTINNIIILITGRMHGTIRDPRLTPAQEIPPDDTDCKIMPLTLQSPSLSHRESFLFLYQLPPATRTGRTECRIGCSASSPQALHSLPWHCLFVPPPLPLLHYS